MLRKVKNIVYYCDKRGHMVDYIILFSSDFVIKCAEKNGNPAQAVAKYLSKAYKKGIKLVDFNSTYVSFSVDFNHAQITSVDDIKAVLDNFLSKKFAGYSASDIMIKNVAELALTEDKRGNIPTEKASENASRDGDKNRLNSVMQEIDMLIGGSEFKALAKELSQLAPQVRKFNTAEVVLSQRYLFSIGDGCGLDTYLKLLQKLIRALKVLATPISDEIVKLKLLADKTIEAPEYSDCPNDYYKSKLINHLVCVDISEWMNRVNTEDFRSVLTSFLDRCKNCLIVFTVPFVDKEVLDNIGDALNDLMFVRKLSFPPLTTEEINKFAMAEASRFGFEFEQGAFPNFQRRIAMENADGRFHGIDTVNKVVRELLYEKQLENAKKGSFDSIIHSTDTAKLCEEEFSNGLSGMEMLDKLVGTDTIKQRVLEIISQIKLAGKNKKVGYPSLHMRFVGNPGTGKTTVARIIGKILKENGILRIGEFHEHSGRDLCGRYIGETAPKTAGICRDAYGSVLFIDEAYSLYRGDSNRDFGREALDTLIAEMENHRNDFVVIMAGYTDEMDNLMKANPGLESRMPYVLEFPNFTRAQLYEVFCSMVEGKIKCSDDFMAVAKQYFDNLSEEWITVKQFSNGRFVRNLFERCCAKAAMRSQLHGLDETVLTVDDFNRSIKDKEFLSAFKKRKIGFGG